MYGVWLARMYAVCTIVSGRSFFSCSWTCWVYFIYMEIIFFLSFMMQICDLLLCRWSLILVAWPIIISINRNLLLHSHCHQFSPRWSLTAGQETFAEGSTSSRRRLPICRILAFLVPLRTRLHATRVASSPWETVEWRMSLSTTRMRSSRTWWTVKLSTVATLQMRFTWFFLPCPLPWRNSTAHHCRLSSRVSLRISGCDGQIHVQTGGLPMFLSWHLAPHRRIFQVSFN